MRGESRDALPETCSAGPPAPLIVEAGARAAYVGPSWSLGRHRNAVAVLAIGLEMPFQSGQREDRRDAASQRCLLIPPGQWHWLDARGGTMGFVYLDACDAAWLRLSAALSNNVDAQVAALSRLASRTVPASEAWEALVREWALPPSAPLDEAVRDAMAHVRRDPGRRHDASFHAARGGCALSTFQRRFTAQAGLPWRRWRQWQRLRCAARAVCGGVDLTTAAHAAGFASGSHFSDAFRATFGLAPKRLVDWGVAWCSVDDSPASMR